MAFYYYSLFKKITTNIPNFINHTYVINTMLMILIVIIFALFIIKNYKKNVRIVLIITMLFISVIEIINQFLKCITINSSKIIFLIAKTNWVSYNHVIIIFY